jgi:hypothetical protein
MKTRQKTSTLPKPAASPRSLPAEALDVVRGGFVIDGKNDVTQEKTGS